MIVPMRKLTLFCLAAERDAALEELRGLGAVHLAPAAPPAGPGLEQARQALARAEAARAAVEAVEGKGTAVTAERADLEERAAELIAQRKTLIDRIDRMRAEEKALLPLGAFDPEGVRRLAAGGVTLRLCVVEGENPPATPAGAVTSVLSRVDGHVWFAVVAAGDDLPLASGVREVPLPSRGLGAVRAESRAATAELETIEREMRAIAGRSDAWTRRLGVLADEAAFAEAKAGMGEAADVLAYVEGYCPEERLADIRRSAGAHGWGFAEREPAADESVPTLIRNPAWSRPIELLMDVIGITPGYRETDISKAFLFFYSIFFAILVGDAGYGAIFLILSALIPKIAPKAPADLPRLLGVLSVATVIWGVLTGAYFGISFDRLPAPLKDLRINWLTEKENMMTLCFLLGAIHLTLAHLWNIARGWNSLQALAQVGWLLMCWVMYFMTQILIFGKPCPSFVLPMFVIGIVLIVLFMTPLGQIKNEWYNHVMLPLNIVGNFGDIVSYVRLYAVGSAGGAISSAFNGMAADFGASGTGGWAIVFGLLAALILFLAHTMNIALAGLGVIVHGVRLNTLEFSGHLGQQWTGFPFRPFARTPVGEEARTEPKA